MAATTTQSFDDRSSAFTYSGSWFQGTWNASSVGETGTLSTTNDLSATVSFTFPAPAVSFSFYGIQRSRGGSYGICVDCNPNNQNFLPVDGFLATDDGQNPPVVLYSRTFSHPAVHIIIIRNQADSRGTPPGNSQLALDRIDLEVLDNSASPTTVTVVSPGTTVVSAQSPLTTTRATTTATSSIQGQSRNTLSTSTIPGSSASTSSSTSGIFNTSATSLDAGASSVSGLIFKSSTALSSAASSDTGSTVPPPPSPALKSPPPMGAIIGGALAALALLAIFLLLIYWLRSRRKQQKSALTQPQPLPLPMPESTKGNPVSHPTANNPKATAASASSVLTPRRRVGHRGNERPGAGGHGPAMSDSTASNSTNLFASVASGSSPPSTSSRPLRETDAGPVPSPSRDSVDENSTLPPEYAVVFRERS